MNVIKIFGHIWSYLDIFWTYLLKYLFLSTGVFVAWSFCRLELLSYGVFVDWGFCRLGLLSYGVFVVGSFCRLGFLSPGLLSPGLLSLGLLSPGLLSCLPFGCTTGYVRKKNMSATWQHFISPAEKKKFYPDR